MNSARNWAELGLFWNVNYEEPPQELEKWLRTAQLHAMASRSRLRLNLENEQQPGGAQLQEIEMNAGRIKKNTKVQSRYTVTTRIEAGTFGQVYQARDLQRSRTLVALKLVDAIKTKNAAREIDFLDAIQLCSDNTNREKIVRLLDVFDVSVNSSRTICFCLELLGLDIDQVITMNEYKPLPPKYALQAIGDVLKGLHFLHDCVHVSHLDIKDTNVCYISRSMQFKYNMRLPSSPYVKIIDFNSASFKQEFGGNRIVCTAGFRPPEVCLSLPFTSNVDIWSTGVLAFQVLMGVKPFRQSGCLGILHGQNESLGPIPQRMLELARPVSDNVTLTGPIRLTTHAFSTREMNLLPKSVEAHFDKNDKTMAQWWNVISKMLSYNAEDRPTAEEILKMPPFHTLK